MNMIDTLDASAIRAQHSTLLLRLLWQERRLSRAELSRRTGLSRSTVSAIVSDLLATHLIQELGAGDSRGGRRPTVLGFDDNACLIAGVDLGASHIGVAITNLRGQVQSWNEQPYPVRTDPQGSLLLVKSTLQKLLNEMGAAPSELVGIGVAVPSPVDPASPGRLSPLLMPAWAGHDVVAAIRAAFDLPVLVDNDANLGALAELWWGAGRDGRDLVYIKVATGIGAGLILDGRIFRGTQGEAGEIGHIAIDPTGPQCVCGLKGCLNVLIGSRCLVERARDGLHMYPRSQLAVRPVSLDTLVDAAQDHDPLACEVMRYAGETLGIGIANLLSLLNPRRIVLGGGLMRAGEPLLGPLCTMVQGRSLRTSVAQVDIVVTQLSEQAIAIGAATRVLEAALDNRAMFAKATEGDGRRNPRPSFVWKSAG